MNYNILSINPGSTSTKFAIFNNGEEVFEETIRHTREEIAQFENVIAQFEYRKNLIVNAIKEKGFDISTLHAVVGRGGLLNPIASGTYLVEDNMVEFVKSAPNGEHASNLGCVISKAIADEIGVNAFIVDPVVVDEMDEIARVSGMPQFERKSIFHALNQKAVAKTFCDDRKLKYTDVNLIVAHLGGGTSVGAHKKGMVVDVNNALDGDGPMSIERSGSVPVGDVYRAAFSGDYTLDQMKKMNVGNGGIVAYLDTISGIEVVERIEKGDKEAELIFNATAYQVAKEIGSCAAVLCGEVDAILLTGGLAYSQLFTDTVTKYVKFISEVVVYPGEDEMLALALGAFRVLNGTEQYRRYE